jgi:putative nucleotidyltransferase with HDIG domain
VLEVVEKVHELHAPDAYAGRELTELAERLDSKDGDTTHHVAAVASLAVAIATQLKIAGEQLSHLEVGALLHDVGKLSIPDRILKKTSHLTELEWAVMRHHPTSGVRLLIRILDLPDVLAVVRSHHERWDGTGYPDGLSGEQIPIGARIVAVADAFQAMLEQRAYRAPRTRAETLAELILNAGTQFDPACVDALRAVLEREELEARRD